MENIPSFEDVAMKDTFNDLYRTIEPLIADGKYDEARQEVKKELRALAVGLGGSLNERLVVVNDEFEAFLPKAARSFLEKKNPESGEMEDERKDAVNAGEESDVEIVAREEKEGWKLMSVEDHALEARMDDMPGKEIQIIGRGKRNLIFVRDLDKKNGIHEGYDYE